MPLKIANIIGKKKPIHFRDKTRKLSIKKLYVELSFVDLRCPPIKPPSRNPPIRRKAKHDSITSAV